LAAEIEKQNKKPNSDPLLIKVALTNNSSDTFSYASMSCSWQDFYFTNVAGLTIAVEVCNSNHPVLIKIAPHKSEVRTLCLLPQNYKELYNMKFKIGVKLLLTQTYKEIHHLKNHIIIWSNELDFNELNKLIY